MQLATIENEKKMKELIEEQEQREELLRLFGDDGGGSRVHLNREIQKLGFRPQTIVAALTSLQINIFTIFMISY